MFENFNFLFCVWTQSMGEYNKQNKFFATMQLQFFKLFQHQCVSYTLNDLWIIMI